MRILYITIGKFDRKITNVCNEVSSIEEAQHSGEVKAGKPLGHTMLFADAIRAETFEALRPR